MASPFEGIDAPTVQIFPNGRKGEGMEGKGRERKGGKGREGKGRGGEGREGRRNPSPLLN